MQLERARNMVPEEVVVEEKRRERLNGHAVLPADEMPICPFIDNDLMFIRPVLV